MPTGYAPWCLDKSPSLKRLVACQCRQEMDAYRLYTVVPYLVAFVEKLTNIYVRYNRKRLKGAAGEDDALSALSTLYATMLTLCKVPPLFPPSLAVHSHHAHAVQGATSPFRPRYYHAHTVEGATFLPSFSCSSLPPCSPPRSHCARCQYFPVLSCSCYYHAHLEMPPFFPSCLALGYLAVKVVTCNIGVQFRCYLFFRPSFSPSMAKNPRGSNLHMVQTGC